MGFRQIYEMGELYETGKNDRLNVFLNPDQLKELQLSIIIKNLRNGRGAINGVVRVSPVEEQVINWPEDIRFWKLYNTTDLVRALEASGVSTEEANEIKSGDDKLARLHQQLNNLETYTEQLTGTALNQGQSTAN